MNEILCNGAGEMPGHEGEPLYSDEVVDDYWLEESKIQEVKQMATLREEALAYEPTQTLNIADLDRVPVDNLEVKEREAQNQAGETFKYKYVEFGGKEYRVPNSVLEEIQTILKLKPEVKNVKVSKTGSGLGTKYKVSALD